MSLQAVTKAGGLLAAALMALYASVVGVVMFFEDKFIYFPTRYPDGDWRIALRALEEGSSVPAIEDCEFRTRDGVKLHGWYCTPPPNGRGVLTPAPAAATLLWFHGNAGNITYRYDMIRRLIALPVNIFIVDYRGYGKSEGAPSEAGLYEDARAAWDYLIARRNIPAERIVIFGKSLGGVPAVDLAAEVRPAGLIVQSSFTSLADMAAILMPFLPRWLLSAKMNSLTKIAKVQCPKLFIHSPADEVVPYTLGRRLFEAAPEPKQFYEVSGATHNETYTVGGAAYIETLRRFVQSCVGIPPTDPGEVAL